MNLFRACLVLYRQAFALEVLRPEDCALQVPCLTYGMRGMIAASVEVKGPARDLHSGNDGGPPRHCALHHTCLT